MSGDIETEKGLQKKKSHCKKHDVCGFNVWKILGFPLKTKKILNRFWIKVWTLIESFIHFPFLSMPRKNKK